jgi:pSer/pThr/pTyr-binding forkhead associated (FHA) protein
MKLILQISWPFDVNREIAVQRFPFVIGRRSDADCSLTLMFVSRRHCRFTRIGDRVLVQDLKSRNGTFVNGKRASSPLPVQDGDELTLGPCSFLVSRLHDTGEMPALRTGLSVAKAPSVRPSHPDHESSAKGEAC